MPENLPNLGKKTDRHLGPGRAKDSKQDETKDIHGKTNCN